MCQETSPSAGECELSSGGASSDADQSGAWSDENENGQDGGIWLEATPSADERELSPGGASSDVETEAYNNVDEGQEDMDEDRSVPAIGALPFCQSVRVLLVLCAHC